MDMVNARTYILMASTIMLAISVLGFAFGEPNQTPTYLLLIMMVLAIWGFATAFNKKK